jgi:hypothetical protein
MGTVKRPGMFPPGRCGMPPESSWLFPAAPFGPAFGPAAFPPATPLLVVKISREVAAFGGNIRISLEAAEFAAGAEFNAIGDAFA